MTRSTRVRILYNHLPAIVRKMPGAAVEIIQETLEEIDDTIKSGMAASGGGRTYVRGGRVHTASAPGQMPAIDTAQLVSSLKHEIARGKYTGYYYTDNPYSVYLEMGTSKMAPRPFFAPAAEKARKLFLRKMKNLEERLR